MNKYRRQVDSLPPVFLFAIRITTRIPGFSNGGELILSEEFHADPEIQDFLEQNAKPDSLSRFTGPVKGFDEPFTMWGLRV